MRLVDFEGGGSVVFWHARDGWRAALMALDHTQDDASEWGETLRSGPNVYARLDTWVGCEHESVDGWASLYLLDPADPRPTFVYDTTEWQYDFATITPVGHDGALAIRAPYGNHRWTARWDPTHRRLVRE